MLYDIHTEDHFRKILRYKTAEVLGESFHPNCAGWRGPGVYSLEPVCYGEAGLVWKHAFPQKKQAPKPRAVQLELGI